MDRILCVAMIRLNSLWVRDNECWIDNNLGSLEGSHSAEVAGRTTSNGEVRRIDDEDCGRGRWLEEDCYPDT